MRQPNILRAAAIFALLTAPPLAQSGQWGDVRSPSFTQLSQLTDPAAKDSVLGQYIDEVNAERDAGRMSYTEAGRLKLAAAMAMYPQDGATHELFAFIAMASEQFDRGEITKAQYDYVTLQKLNEHNAQVRARQAAEQRATDEQALAQYEADMRRIEADAAQRADQMQFIENAIRRRYGQPPQRIGIDIPRSCSTVPDGAGGWRTQCN